MVLVELLALSFSVLAICLIFGIPIIAIYLDYKKKMAMIERGLVPEDEKSRPEDRLGWGIVILGIGLSFIIGWLFNLNGQIIAGLILASIGIALLVSYNNLQKKLNIK